MAGMDHKRKKTGFFAGDLDPPPDGHDEARWNGIMSRFKSKKITSIPTPKKTFSRRDSLLDDIDAFIKDREKRRDQRRRLNETSFFGTDDGNTTFYGNNTTISSEIVEPAVVRLNGFENVVKMRDAATMTTFEPSFLQSLDASKFEDAVNESQDVDFVPDSQMPTENEQRTFRGANSPRDPVDSLYGMDDFMREAFNATFENAKTARTPIITHKDPQPTPVPTSKSKPGNIQCDSTRRNKHFDRENGKTVAVESAPEAQNRTVGGIKGMVCEVTAALEAKERPYIKSLLGDVVSRQAKYAHKLLYSQGDDGGLTAKTATDNLIADVLGGREKKKKRKTNIICGVDVSKHPQPPVPVNSSSSLVSESFNLPKDDGGALFPTPRVPKPVSPGSKKLRKQLGFAVPDDVKKPKPMQNTPSIGTYKRSIGEAFKDVRD